MTVDQPSQSPMTYTTCGNCGVTVAINSWPVDADHDCGRGSPRVDYGSWTFRDGYYPHMRHPIMPNRYP